MSLVIHPENIKKGDKIFYESMDTRSSTETIIRIEHCLDHECGGGVDSLNCYRKRAIWSHYNGWCLLKRRVFFRVSEALTINKVTEV